MKTLYLHIGMAKTATTSIQNLCADNQDLLKQQGYYYPVFSFKYPYTALQRNGHFLFGQAVDKNGNRDKNLELSQRKACFSHIYDMFETYDNIVLSDEGLWNRGITNELNVWEMLQHEMEQHDFTIKIVAYLRRQDEYLYSWWNQRIKGGFRNEKNLTWEEMLEKLPLVKLDYYEVLETIAQYIGKENMIVRRFGTPYFIHHSIYDDFLDSIGLSLTDEYVIAKQFHNESLSINNIEIRRILNYLSYNNIQESFEYRDTLLSLSSIKRNDNHYSMYTQEEAYHLLQQYEESNNKVAKEYLGIDEPLFQFSFENAEKWTPDNKDMIGDVVLFAGQEILNLKRQLAETNQLISQQQNQIHYLQSQLSHPVKAATRKMRKLLPANSRK